MISLSNETLGHLGPDVTVPAYDRRALTAGIAHIGVGNFHRTHQAIYIDRCLHRPGQAEWAIVGIGLTDGPEARAKAKAFRDQDCLYTVTEYAPDGSGSTRVIGAMIDYLHAPSETDAVLDLLSSAAIRIVTLTITEGGYNIDEATGLFILDAPDVARDLAGQHGADQPPRTTFGLIVEALKRRRGKGIPPFAVVSCDNLRHNGDTSKKSIVSYATAHDAALGAWIENTVPFPNSMVDRIAPRVSDQDRVRLAADSGIDDRVPAVSESFIQWVMQDHFPAGRPDLDAVGVELRDDVALFETVKGRLLNASHMLMSYPSLLCGHRLVHDAMRDPRIAGLLDAFMDRDAIPILQGPPGLSLVDYKNMVLSRFSNPAVGDQLLRIAHNGADKIPVFHTKTLEIMLAEGRDLTREAFFLACFARYFSGRDDSGAVFEVLEPNVSDEERAKLADADGLGLLRMKAFQALGMDRHEGFVTAYRAAAEVIARDGAGPALARLLGL